MIHLLDAKTLKDLISQDKALIIDVREPSEYNESHIEGSTLIPLATLTIQKVKDLIKDDQKIVINCRSGGRSLRACQMLNEYDNQLDVYNLEGGIIAWNTLNKSEQSEQNYGSCSIGVGCSSGGCN